MPVDNSQESRLAVLEIEVAHIKTDHTNTRSWLSSIDGKVDDIKSRLDKQNGAIPHMQEDIEDMSNSLNALHAKLEELRDTGTDTKFKTGIMWGGLAIIVSGLIAAVVNFFVG